MLLKTLVSEQDSSVRRKVGDAVVVVAKQTLADFETAEEAAREARSPMPADAHFWPELLQGLWECAQQKSPELRETALNVLAEVPNVFGSQLSKYLGQIRQLLQASMQDVGNVGVMVAASKAFAAFLVELSNPEQTAAMLMIFPLVLQVRCKCICYCFPSLIISAIALSRCPHLAWV